MTYISATMQPASTPDSLRQRARQKRILVVLGAVLIVAGLLLLLVLERVPMPLRILMGLGDLVAGAVLLLVARQKFRTDPPPPAPEERRG